MKKWISIMLCIVCFCCLASGCKKEEKTAPDTLCVRRGSSFSCCYCRSGWYSLQVHFFHFRPLPQGHGSLRPILMTRRWGRF